MIEVITGNSLKDYFKSLKVIDLLIRIISRKQLQHLLRNDLTLMSLMKVENNWFREKAINFEKFLGYLRLYNEISWWHLHQKAISVRWKFL